MTASWPGITRIVGTSGRATEIFEGVDGEDRMLRICECPLVGHEQKTGWLRTNEFGGSYAVEIVIADDRELGSRILDSVCAVLADVDCRSSV